MEYNYERADILDVCKEVTDTFVIRAKEKKLFLDLKIPDSSLPLAMTDRRRIVEVISNIIDNAIKYTDEGGITVSLSKDSSFVKVSVKDTGIGIPKKELPYLFTKFSRGKDITRLSATGTCLGLHVSRSMIEAMGGKVTVQSDGIKRGSVFTIHVPIEV
jgi:signal transduction histidine kinase